MKYSCILLDDIAAYRLCHYLLAHCLNLVIQFRLKYLLSRPGKFGLLARWLLMFSKFDITVVTPREL